MDQTVNLTSLTSVVRIYLFPPPKGDIRQGIAFCVAGKDNKQITGFAVIHVNLMALFFEYVPSFFSQGDALPSETSILSNEDFVTAKIKIHRRGERIAHERLYNAGHHKFWKRKP